MKLAIAIIQPIIDVTVHLRSTKPKAKYNITNTTPAYSHRKLLVMGSNKYDKFIGCTKSGHYNEVVLQ